MTVSLRAGADSTIRGHPPTHRVGGAAQQGWKDGRVLDRRVASDADRRAVVADVVAVLVFVLVGRTAHREGGAVSGFVVAAWPFLAGTALGWLAVAALRRAGRRLPGRSTATGLVVLVGAAVGGWTLRRLLTRADTPVSFLLVATVFLALFLLGRRVAANLLRRRTA
jgi:hypothetical protein